MLRLLGHEVRLAHDGEAAVQAVEAFRPGLILMDIGMPRLNGYDACRRIRGQPWGKGVAMVALTGWVQEEDKRRSKEAGFDGHLSSRWSRRPWWNCWGGSSRRRPEGRAVRAQRDEAAGRISRPVSSCQRPGVRVEFSVEMGW
jgi:hypothetical protein